MAAPDVLIGIALILLALALTGIVALLIPTRHRGELPYWSDDDIRPPTWVNHRPHHGRCRYGAWHEGCQR